MIISRYHLPTRGTPEIVQIASADLHAVLSEALHALNRCRPQIVGAIPIQDAESAIRSLRSALADLAGCSDEPQTTKPPHSPKAGEGER